MTKIIFATTKKRRSIVEVVREISINTARQTEPKTPTTTKKFDQYL